MKKENKRIITTVGVIFGFILLMCVLVGGQSNSSTPTTPEFTPASQTTSDVAPETTTPEEPTETPEPTPAPSEDTTPPALTPAPTPKSNCDPNYTGCVPIASDVDCAGGSGDGPAYTGATQVIGTDIYGLDRDGDGYACE